MRDAGSGDKLARGAHKASYLVTENSVTNRKWNSMFKGSGEPELKAVYCLECPVHGVFKTKKEFFLSGGYPQGPDSYVTGKCFNPDCDEKAAYNGYVALDAPKPEPTPSFVPEALK